jgi:hypothetical protein
MTKQALIDQLTVCVNMLAETSEEVVVLKDMIEALPDDEKTLDRPLPRNSYVYRFWQDNECVYIGSGTGDRAWQRRHYLDPNDSKVKVEIIIDGLDRNVAYSLESKFLADFIEQTGCTPVYNIDITNEYHQPDDSAPGPWRLVYYTNNHKIIAYTPIFKTPIRSVTGLCKSARANKINTVGHQWVPGLETYSYVIIHTGDIP